VQKGRVLVVPGSLFLSPPSPFMRPPRIAGSEHRFRQWAERGSSNVVGCGSPGFFSLLSCPLTDRESGLFLKKNNHPNVFSVPCPRPPGCMRRRSSSFFSPGLIFYQLLELSRYPAGEPGLSVSLTYLFRSVREIWRLPGIEIPAEVIPSCGETLG